MLQFEWDPKKADQNKRKHDVSFKEAATLFSDPLSITFPDPNHSVGEERYITIGISEFDRLIIVSHLDIKDNIRIISARKATKRERQFYEEK